MAVFARVLTVLEGFRQYVPAEGPPTGPDLTGRIGGRGAETVLPVVSRELPTGMAEMVGSPAVRPTSPSTQWWRWASSPETPLLSAVTMERIGECMAVLGVVASVNIARWNGGIGPIPRDGVAVYF